MTTSSLLIVPDNNNVPVKFPQQQEETYQGLTHQSGLLRSSLPMFPLLQPKPTVMTAPAVIPAGLAPFPQLATANNNNNKKNVHHYQHSLLPRSATPPLNSPLQQQPLLDHRDYSKELAKEALRISKESLQQHQQRTNNINTAPNKRVGSFCSSIKPTTTTTTSTVSPNTVTTTTFSTNVPLLPTPTTTSTATLVTKKSISTSSSHNNSGSTSSCNNGGGRLNKFVRRLHEMLRIEQQHGIVEWRKGLLVLHSTAVFAKQILPKYFNTKNFKTFRRQLNYYGFVHVRSFSTTGSCTTALWVNQHLAQVGSEDINSVLLLKRVEPDESAKTAEGRRVRKELAIHTVEEDLGVSTKMLQMDQIRAMALRQSNNGGDSNSVNTSTTSSDKSLEVPAEISVQDQQQQQASHYSHDSFSSFETVPSIGKSSTNFHLKETVTTKYGQGQQQHQPFCAPRTTRDESGAADLLLLLSQAATVMDMDL